MSLNHLAGATSPYLRQHASNPVDWYPWGEEAFARARRENKPIFLSVGYSTCHWCHVMERESFSDPETARLLNASFVCIKVDREERPDIDRVYQTFLQASTGGGGWPMSVWLTPELKPFFGGTYFAAADAPDRPGFRTVITHLARLWTERRDDVVAQSQEMLSALLADTHEVAATGQVPLRELRAHALAQLAESFDPEHGGFETAPKFPTPVNLEFLFDVAGTAAAETERATARRLALTTLRAIVAGGIHDQVGGGFHRYATDAAWRVPHFEKMLYDQAQLAHACLTGWQLSADPALRAAAADTLAYVRRRLTSPDGGFYTAEDADSATAADAAHAGEGAFYIWTADELASVLGAAEAPLFCHAFGVSPEGNVTGDAVAEFRGENILYRAHTDNDCAARFDLSVAEVASRLHADREKLRAVRERRPRPLRDDKIVTAWNGLMISAFARGAQALDDPTLAETASRAATFLQDKLFDPATGKLARSYCAGRCDAAGFAEDYAFLIQGLLDLYETTFETRWLEWVVRLQETQNRLFGDEAGGYFANAAGDARVLLRLKDENDGAEPTASSVAVRNLARLGALLHREDCIALARRTAAAFAPQLERSPTALPQLLASAGWLEGSPQQILIVGDRAAPATRAMIAPVWHRFRPRRALAVIDAQSRPFFRASVPLVDEFPDAKPGVATGYVCANFACQMPAENAAALEAELDETAGPKR